MINNEKMDDLWEKMLKKHGKETLKVISYRSLFLAVINYRPSQVEKTRALKWAEKIKKRERR